MAARKVSKKRAQLLADLEHLVGRGCYNSSIQNWGPGGVFEGEGRDFRYPLTLVNEDGSKRKVRFKADADAPAALMTGYYAFGANQLQIMMALDDVLRHLEAHHGLKL
jgi:hypothetical protein